MERGSERGGDGRLEGDMKEFESVYVREGGRKLVGEGTGE